MKFSRLALLVLLTGPVFAAPKLPLQKAWSIQSSCKVTEPGEVISTAAFHPTDWYPATVPNSVVGNLVADKVYPSPYYGMDLRKIPGATYPIGTIFANQPMPDDSPFKCSWWYRTEFTVPAAQKGNKVWLHFDGINYRANIWLNGQRIADSTQVAGAWRLYEFEVSANIEFDKPNVLAVEVSSPTENDLAINWVDWSPTPPDKNMGLWRDVFLTFSGPVSLRYPQVVSKVTLPSSAELTVSAELRNAGNEAVRGTLKAEIEKLALSQKVDLAPGEVKVVTFSPEQFPQLKLSNPRLWWPVQVGTPNLYPLSMEFVAGGKVSDSVNTHFGIREITSELNAKGYRQFKVNGKNILIRGGGWAPDMLLNASEQRLEEEIRYTRHLGLNTIRLEGKLETDHFFDLADRYGILIMAGWCCCDIWERWTKWGPEHHQVAVESLKSQILRLRNHPSLLVWLNGSDNPPPAEVEQDYIAVLKALHWPNPYISSATAKPTTVTGASGVKMTGPYEYVPPSYWLADTGKRGGAWGFNTETSPGPAIPPAQSIRRMLPREHWWPIDEFWSFHAGAGHFKTLDVFTDALNARYGTAVSMEDYTRKSQAMAYDGERAMFEAYSRNKYTSTGVIQWMLNNAWPSMIWHLYDWYLMPGGGYFGTRKACEPLHVQYSYDDRSVVVVNSLYKAFPGMKVTAKIYNLDMTEKFSLEGNIDIGEDSSTPAFAIPEIDGLSTTYFVRLELRDHAGKPVSTNFYWLSTKPDVMVWEKSLGYVTPTSQHADLTGLNTLPIVETSLSSAVETRGEEGEVSVTVSNPGKSLAFLVRLRLTDETGEDVLPILWDDNFFALMPGETRHISGHYAVRDLHGEPYVHLEGWNVMPMAQRPRASAARRATAGAGQD